MNTIPDSRSQSSASALKSKSGMLHHFWASLSAMTILVIICCGAYPALVWGIGQALFPNQANGSLLTKDGSYTTKDTESVGSALLAQGFAAPHYFHPRPSAAGSGYDATSSGGTNLGPLSDKLINGVHGSKKPDGTPDPNSDFDGVKDLVAAYRKENSLPDTTLVPADAVTRSASGLDPHITPLNAKLQMARVATARGMTVDAVAKVVDQFTDRPTFGILGDPGVNVLQVNIALDKIAPVASTQTAPSTEPSTAPSTAPTSAPATQPAAMKPGATLRIGARQLPVGGTTTGPIASTASSIRIGSRRLPTTDGTGLSSVSTTGLVRIAARALPSA